ncbi:hypothetical protein FRC02_010532 [Tulasnella sp. 418]|nr:hypothetical protein FRC02_010532 [Tulasnella sp. 418]
MSHIRAWFSLAALAATLPLTAAAPTAAKGDNPPGGPQLPLASQNGLPVFASNLAATAWKVEGKSDYAGGVRLFYVDTSLDKTCDGIQELTSTHQGGDIGQKSSNSFIAQEWHKTYCLSRTTFGINPNAAFAATSLAGSYKNGNKKYDQDLLDLHLFYWSVNQRGENIVKDARWSPHMESNAWKVPTVPLGHAVQDALTDYLSALTWLSPVSGLPNWSVFYIQHTNGAFWLKELTLAANLKGWTNQKDTLKVKLTGKVQEVGGLQATVWVANGKVYKRVYVRDARTNVVHEYGSISSGAQAKPISWIGQMPLGNVKSFAVNTNGAGAGLRMYTNQDDQKVTEWWPTATPNELRGSINLSGISLTSDVKGIKAKDSTKIASAVQRSNGNSWQFTFYLGLDNKILQSHRDMRGWIQAAMVTWV